MRLCNRSLSAMLAPAGLFIVALGLGACAAFDANAPRAQLKAPQSLGAISSEQSGAEVAGRPGWQALQDPALDALIKQALADSPNLQLAATRIRRASALTEAANSALLPQLTAGYDGTQQRFTEKGLYPAPLAGSWHSNNRLALDASLELDLWGKYRSALKGAQALRQVAEAEAEAARIALSTALARSWNELDRLYQQRDATQAMLALREQLRDLYALRVGAGLDAPLDRHQQEGVLANAGLELAALDERIAVQRNAIAALAGQGPAQAAQLPRPAIPGQVHAALPSLLPAELLARRPDLLAARWRVEAASRDIDVAQKQFYPSVNLLAFMGYSSIGVDKLLLPEARIFGAGPAIRLPVFEAGRLSANLAIKSADYDAAVAAYNNTLVEAMREVCDIASGLQALQGLHASQQAALDAAERNLALIEARLRGRQASRIQLIHAQLQRMNQARNDIDLMARGRDLALSLARATGGDYLPQYSPFTLAAQLQPTQP